MTPFMAWGAETLLASAVLMVLVLAIRAPVRRWVGPRLAYALWALPALRMILPPLPFDAPVARVSGAGMSVLFVGPQAALASIGGSPAPAGGEAVLAVWLAGALGLLGLYALRHGRFCRRLRQHGRLLDMIGTLHVLETDVEGPLAFGVLRRFIAVPRHFLRDYDAGERDLVLAHECLHHARGDLAANWIALVVLALHWWNPVAWAAIRAFREDQEFAVDAQVLGSRGRIALPLYAYALAKAAGIGAPPMCHLTTRSNLKGRLMMLSQKPRSNRCLAFGGLVLSLLGGAALAATAAAPGTSGLLPNRQAVTIGVKPDGAGGFALIVDGKAFGAGGAVPDGKVLPPDFDPAGGCPLKREARPHAMVVKGEGGAATYTVMCASAAPATVRATLAEGLASLRVMRASVAVQQSPTFPPSERAHALRAIDQSIREVEATLQNMHEDAGR